jgi:hypothetical protein
MTVRLMLSALVCGGLLAMAVPAQAAGPRNPYSSFNLSGINYGAQQWERAQREGRRVWPYSNTPGRTSSRSGISAGGFVGGGGGVIVQGGGSSRPMQRPYRRWRR